ncbi:MAG: TRAP transporter large permease [Defluviitaleaceae bacterium]|nr:TRAP transporter large permease [Defluviitaleaceae bacterium]
MVAVMIVVFLLLLMLGVPIAFSLGISSMIYLLFTDTPLVLIGQRTYAGMDSFVMIAIPAFMLAGGLMNTGGVTKRLLKLSNSLVGHFRGSLALVNVLSSKLFAGITGTALADVVSLGSMLIPAMEESEYEKDFAVALTASTSIISAIIPPSMPMVIAGSAVAISVGGMFAGGILPGLLLGVTLFFQVMFIANRRNFPKTRKHSLREILITAKAAIGAVLMPLILMVGILGGIFTPTEAAVVTVAYALLVCTCFYKELTFKLIFRAVVRTMRSAGSILLLVGLASVFATILVTERVPQFIADSILGFTDNYFLVILIINLILLFVGMFMETIASILIMFPVLMPVALGIGMSPVQFGVMAVTNLLIGLVTPPVGICLATAAQIGRVSMWDALKANMPFLGTLLLILLLVAYVPPLTTWLPSLLN